MMFDPLIRLPGTDRPTIERIPDPPLTEEQLRLESIRIAAVWTAGFNSTTKDLVQIADKIKEYIRPHNE